MFSRKILTVLAGAGCSIISILFAHTLSATELTLPASLQQNAAMLAPPYMSVTTPQATIPALGNWAEVNQRVHQIGGWMFYATEGSGQHEQHRQHQMSEPKANKHEGH
ncbi:hypothetical protein VT06_12265 [Arsukibacterium sp. MJ3]|uniref:hypothetical protein n=1 Tax=Arsukibacterium sp. MJ3 TaxID=1632859 RepID=UPI0006270064|nr:hypothetical protein [Arsukibacterium sp. MJ3]KKO48302.1 hypothetical protein VT06_12265 [Arsukibacterium sp. MJ3]